eukprot:3529549-Pleurochrysis_carterae.AAC.1
MRFDIACEGKQVEVEGSMLRLERAEEGSNIGWHLETLRVYPQPCTQGVEVLKSTAAACVSHGVCSAKDMAHMEPRCIEKGRHCMQVKSRRERVRLKHHTQKVTKGVVEGCNCGNKGHEFECGNAVGTTCGGREG